MKGIITLENVHDEDVKDKLDRISQIQTAVKTVTTKEVVYTLKEHGTHVAVMDFGV